VETPGTERNVNNGRTPCSFIRTPHNNMNAKNGRDASHSRDASNIKDTNNGGITPGAEELLTIAGPQQQQKRYANSSINAKNSRDATTEKTQHRRNTTNRIQEKQSEKIGQVF
jgi:hypothetical protein